MELHYGQVVEKRIRQNGYSITELARLTNVNRRSVYNWFNQKRLKSSIIHRIGCALDYDFSIDFPDLFSPQDFKPSNYRMVLLSAQGGTKITEYADDNLWKDKYLSLLEKYHQLLNKQIFDLEVSILLDGKTK